MIKFTDEIHTGQLRKWLAAAEHLGELPDLFMVVHVYKNELGEFVDILDGGTLFKGFSASGVIAASELVT